MNRFGIGEEPEVLEVEQELADLPYEYWDDQASYLADGVVGEGVQAGDLF
jgi:hypothetical protein